MPTVLIPDIKEAVIQRDTHVLYCLPGLRTSASAAIEELQADFFGIVQTGLPPHDLHPSKYAPGAHLYFCGDVMSVFSRLTEEILPYVHFIQGYCVYSAEIDMGDWRQAELGQVPRNVHGVGVYFPKVPDLDASNYYDRVQDAHAPQALTESTKVGAAYRKGIYLSRVSATENGNRNFHLLRCSTNLQGPTENFRHVDEEIVQHANTGAVLAFGNTAAELNHVLAQVYTNVAAVPATSDCTESNEKKARIKQHSDKTKDMPCNGILAFATFYSSDLQSKGKMTADATPDYKYKSASVLTRLRWRLKSCVPVAERLALGLKDQFEVTLHPDSLFLVPLSTNRLYTHEVVPSTLPVDKVPTRLGYVVRCSNTVAVHDSRKGETWLHGQPLVQPSEADLESMRRLYKEENGGKERVVYEDTFYSMNGGDYLSPSLRMDRRE